MKKTISKIINFVVVHPIWSIIITGLIITFFTGFKSREWNFAGGFLITLIIFAFFAPFIRKARDKKERREDIDYLAEKIAEEQKK